MNRWAVAGLASAAKLRVCSARRSILASAEASDSGAPLISAPPRSAAY